MKAQGSASQQCLLFLFLLFLFLLEFDIAAKCIVLLHRITWNLGNLSLPALLAFEGLPESWSSEALWQDLPIIREHTDMKAQKLSVLCLLHHFRIQVMYLVHVILQFITALQKFTKKAELALCGNMLQLSYSLNMLCTWARNDKRIFPSGNHSPYRLWHSTELGLIDPAGYSRTFIYCDMGINGRVSQRQVLKLDKRERKK